MSYGSFKDMSPGLGSPIYDHPSSRATAIIYQTVYGGQIISSESPCGANCTLTQSFVGPTYKCDQLDPYDPEAPWCKEPFNPNSKCEDVIGDFGLTDPKNVWWYETRNSSVSNSTRAVLKPWTEGVLWVRHKYLPAEFRKSYNYSTPYQPRIPGSAWHNFTFRCRPHNARFDITRTYKNFELHIEGSTTYVRETGLVYSALMTCRYLDPIKYGMVGSDYQFIEGNTDDPKNYASYAIHETLYSILFGVVGTTSRGAAFDSTGLDGTKLVEDVAFPAELGIRRPLPNLRELVEQLHFNTTISLLSVDNLMYKQAQDAKATITTSTNVFSYNRSALLLTYGTALTAGLVAVFIGLKSLWDNGVSMGIGFLATLTTTRNRTLDELAAGACLGAEPMPDRLRATEVRFGELSAQSMPKEEAEKLRGGDNRHASFGVSGEIAVLQYGVPYR